MGAREARRTSWLPVQLPADVPRSTEHLTLVNLAIDSREGREVLHRRTGEGLTWELLMALDHGAGKTGLIRRKPFRQVDHSLTSYDDDAFDTLGAALASAGRPSRVTEFYGDFLPPWPDALQGFDQILLTADRISRDAAGVASLRAWVREGGRLWVMLDRVDPSVVGGLLGNEVDFTVVDRVDLDQFAIHSTDQLRPAKSAEAAEYDQPVELVRLLASTSDVSHRIDGWPAALWIRSGEGEILLTTLAPNGWRKENSEQPTNSLEELAERFFSARPELPSVEVLQTGLEEQIGYRIPPRWLATLLLGGYCLGLLAAWKVLASRRRLEWLAVIAPGITAVGAFTFFALGATNSAAVPPTIAVTQLLRVAPETNEVRIQGLVATYDQQSRDVAWRTQARSRITGEQAGDSEVRRQLWTDNDGMEILNATTFASSVGIASHSGLRSLSQPARALAQFGPEGLVGRLAAGELQGARELVILSPPGPALALIVGRDGSFVGNVDQLLPPGQYVTDVLLSDEQRRRQEACRRLLDPTEKRIFPHQPTLALWCDAIQSGLEYPAEFVVKTEALALLPLELQPTPPRSRFQVPATFLRIDDASRGKSGGSSSAYDPRSGRWIKGHTRSTETLLRFQLPKQVIPCRLDRGTFTVRINAPSREFSLWTLGPEQPTRVGHAVNPNGVLTFELGSQDLDLDENGGVQFRVAVGEIQGRGENGGASAPNFSTEINANPWQIDYVRLSVAGETF